MNAYEEKQAARKEMKYAELMLLSIDDVYSYHKQNPNSKAVSNAIRQLEHERNNRAALVKIGKRRATVCGKTKNKRKPNRKWCPTARSLK